MVEPDNITLEHLRAIRAELGEVKRTIDEIGRKLDTKADAGQVAALELKLSGLTHAVMSGFGSVVHRLDSIHARLSRLERERV
jgi:hypothetical protein